MSDEHTNVSRGLRRYAVLAIPIIALLVAGRQFYLSKNDDLTVWKGGGMGMFASSDNTGGRFLRIWGGPPGGPKHYISQLLKNQQPLRVRARNFPTEPRMRAIADAIRVTQFQAPGQPPAVRVLDADRKQLRRTRRRFHTLIATGPRLKQEPLEWEVRIEFWRMHLDPETGRSRATLEKTFEFPAAAS